MHIREAVLVIVSKNQRKVTGYQCPRCHWKIQWNPLENSVESHWKFSEIPLEIQWNPTGNSVKSHWKFSEIPLEIQ